MPRRLLPLRWEGTVKDPQGGVIPGATLTLISETLGTQTTDVFSNEYGDFVFANIRPDRYIVQVSMDGFKTFRRAGINVSPSDRVGLGQSSLRQRRERSENVPAAQRQRAWRELQLRGPSADTIAARLAARRSRGLSALVVVANNVQVFGMGTAESNHLRIDPRIQRHAAVQASRQHDGNHGQLHGSARPCSSKDAYKALNTVKPPIWENDRIVMPPAFQWGNRIVSGNATTTGPSAPPNVPFP